MQRHFRRLSSIRRWSRPSLALTAMAALVFGLSGPGASSNAAAAGTGKTSANPNADCATSDSVGSSAYASQIGAIEKEITSSGRLGGSFPDPVYVEVNTMNVLFPGDTEAAPLYTSGCFRGAIPTTGPVDSCTVHVQPIALSGKDALSTSDIHEALIHEMVHCYMFQRFGAATYGFPDWFIEGSADWVANEIAGSHIVDGHWESYLEHPDKTLWNRDYDGVGFFVHLAESGTNPWQKIIPMAAALVASGNSNVSGVERGRPHDGIPRQLGRGFRPGPLPGDAVGQHRPGPAPVPGRVARPEAREGPGPDYRPVRRGSNGDSAARRRLAGRPRHCGSNLVWAHQPWRREGRHPGEGTGSQLLHRLDGLPMPDR